ncbi:3-isopropylmalate dehydratase large subunit [Saccharothrix coeruleofusca]|uniref:3-isopropylmalate dehydratase large subunit n=1 Tax=Saccharothrix coeruleofusca TaxID=33919 RepID=A0A918ARM0_9PSEU|nr:3-isopropylmalate dehydratase large subunit [Saccharothrix coeruleofusca]MBP2336015.1 3-isopropylmalate/(R)-2-methylmalate dehydratase large subunit [Saccharothrix coeruleofusca]GGP75996.1 3-isopropylmalate dehydratase large subunit [Saccharothrix coeruleofusca]
MSAPRTIIDKVWDDHVVRSGDASDLLYIDLHLVHEVTSPQAFDGIEHQGRAVRRPDLTLAVEDHNVPTDSLLIRDAMSKAQVQQLRANCERHGIEHLAHGDGRQGVVHVVAPELGLVQPGMTVVCGDSHTSTHGALGALAFGVGTSDVEHVLATQTLSLARPRTMAVEFTGALPPDVSPKDLVMALIAQIGANGAHGHVLEYRGPVIRQISMEGRMSICNMTVEAGARAGLVAPDEITEDYLAGRPAAPTGAQWDDAVAAWRELRTDEGARFDRTVVVDTSELTPFVTWGTNPGQAAPLGDGVVPDPDSFSEPGEQAAARRALAYMGLEPGTRMRDIPIDTVFLGSCTNGRIEDLRAAAAVLDGRKVAPGVRMIVVPGSMQVRAQAEREGLDEVFTAAGAQWRLAGCSMCLGMNNDRLGGPARVASTSNRNYERRQGDHARTHLVSPSTAAATAVAGHLASPRDLIGGDR